MKSVMLPTESSATVFIWFPRANNIGHCSMYIGNLSLEIQTQHKLMSLSRIERNSYQAGFTEEQLDSRPVHPNYVSWWYGYFNSPEGMDVPGGVLAEDLYRDCQREDTEPHVIYQLYGLNDIAMEFCWQHIDNKYSDIGYRPSYHFLSKNCSTVVARILKAGGIGLYAGNYFSTHKLIWTPKSVARLCEIMKQKNMAAKIKTADCPRKINSIHWLLLGLR